jgi:hypothetical protein
VRHWHALIFDYLNFRTGRLDPSYAAIARAANVRERAVATALKRLKELRILNWLRRCTESRRDDGRYCAGAGHQRLCGTTVRAMARLPRAPGGPASRTRDMGSARPHALGARGCGAGERSADQAQLLALAPKNGLEAALASLGGAVAERGLA